METKTRPEIAISPAELGERLEEILEGVRVTGERFVVEIDGQRVAELAPPGVRLGPTLGDFFALLDSLPRPDDRFADDLALIQATQPVAEFHESPD